MATANSIFSTSVASCPPDFPSGCPASSCSSSSSSASGPFLSLTLAAIVLSRIPSDSCAFKKLSAPSSSNADLSAKKARGRNLSVTKAGFLRLIVLASSIH
eukprot:scaffold1580_cov162-Pinguiococcus_pyrenoidosus.AAC.2